MSCRRSISRARGLAPDESEAEWLQLAESAEGSTGLARDRELFGGDASLARGPVQEGIASLHTLFTRAPELGSLLDPESLGSDLFRADFKSLAELFDMAMRRQTGSAGRDERAVAAAGMARAAEILRGRYTLVVTNVPFLARGKQGSGLRGFAERPPRRCQGRHRHGVRVANLRVAGRGGDTGGGDTAELVVPEELSEAAGEVAEGADVESGARRLGTKRVRHDHRACGTSMLMLNILSSEVPVDRDWEMAGVDVSSPWGQRPIKAAEKGELLRGEAGVVMSKQAEQLKNPDAAVLTTPLPPHHPLSHYANSYHGVSTTDYARFGRAFWELVDIGRDWIWQQSTVAATVPFGGRKNVLLWERGAGQLNDLRKTGVPIVITGLEAWGRSGIAVSQVGHTPVTLYTGESFDDNTGILVPNDRSLLPAISSFCASSSYSQLLRMLDQSLKVTYPTLVKVPFDLDHWKKVAADQYPNGLPEPYSDDPTQWIFHGAPCRSVIWNEETKRTDHSPPRIDGTVLQVAVARLLGYRWPAELDPAMRLAPEQRDVADDCRAFDEFADPDGIVCLSATQGEPNAADRLRGLLAHACGDQWSVATERALLATTSPKPPKSLEDWLRDRFFREHCKLFHNRPFIWHIWDGCKDGFHALVNYHRLAGQESEGSRTLGSLTFAYLNEWIERQRTDQGEGIPGADGRLAAALDLQQQLQHIRTGEPPCDIFVRWRPLHEQAIGWEPDINDGVRLNIRPFLRAQLRKGGRAGAGILRWKPNISWKKDRGKEPDEPRPPEDFPWFWGCPGGGSEGQRTDFRAGPDAEFDGNRWNDLHYTRATKEDVRNRATEGEQQL